MKRYLGMLLLAPSIALADNKFLNFTLANGTTSGIEVVVEVSQSRNGSPRRTVAPLADFRVSFGDNSTAEIKGTYTIKKGDFIMPFYPTYDVDHVYFSEGIVMHVSVPHKDKVLETEFKPVNNNTYRVIINEKGEAEVKNIN